MGNLESSEEKCMGPSTRCAAAEMDLDIRKKQKVSLKLHRLFRLHFLYERICCKHVVGDGHTCRYANLIAVAANGSSSFCSQVRRECLVWLQRGSSHACREEIKGIKEWVRVDCEITSSLVCNTPNFRFLFTFLKGLLLFLNLNAIWGSPLASFFLSLSLSLSFFLISRVLVVLHLFASFFCCLGINVLINSLPC